MDFCTGAVPTPVVEGIGQGSHKPSKIKMYGNEIGGESHCVTSLNAPFLKTALRDDLLAIPLLTHVHRVTTAKRLLITSLLIRMLVPRIDINKDGFVEEAELEIWVRHKMQKWTVNENVDAIFRDLDANNDYQVTWKEYMVRTFRFTEEGKCATPTNRRLSH